MRNNEAALLEDGHPESKRAKIEQILEKDKSVDDDGYDPEDMRHVEAVNEVLSKVVDQITNPDQPTTSEAAQLAPLKLGNLLELAVVNTRRFPSMTYGFKIPPASFELNSDFKNFTRKLLNLEEYCDAPANKRIEVRKMFSDVNVDLFEALHSPHMISDRTPMHDGMKICVGEESVKQMWCRLVSHFFEWICGISEFQLLDPKDKLALAAAQLCRVICFNVAYMTYLENVDNGLLVYGGGMYLDTSIRGHSKLFQLYSEALVDILHSSILPQMKAVDFTQEEFVLMKVVLFFNTNHMLGLSPRGRKLTLSFLNKYRTILTETIRAKVFEKNPGMSADEVHNRTVERVQKVLSIPHNLESMGQVDDFFLIKMVEINMGGLFGTLTKQVHLERGHRSAFTQGELPGPYNPDLDNDSAGTMLNDAAKSEPGNEPEKDGRDNKEVKCE